MGKYAVLGHGIEYSKSPQIHLASALDLNLICDFTILDYSATELESFLLNREYLDFAGFSVTTPYKAVLAKALGAKVAVTAGSQDKLNVCASLGADLLINYKDQDFVDVIRDTWGGTDNILDNMGASYLTKNVEALKRNGHLAIIGMQGGTKVDFHIDKLLRKNATITATSLRGRPESEKSMICREVEKIVWPWITDGTVKQVIDRVMPIEKAGEAHKVIDAGQATGKVVLQVR